MRIRIWIQEALKGLKRRKNASKSQIITVDIKMIKSKVIGLNWVNVI
jgi:hypothetical protein